MRLFRKLVILLVMVLFSSGCTNLDVYLKVDANGGTRTTVTARPEGKLPTELASLTPPPELKQLLPKGITVPTSAKAYGYQCERGWWYTKYRLNWTADWTDGGGLDLSRVLVGQAVFRLVVDLPVVPSVHNADEVSNNGTRLVWNLKPGKVNQVRFQAQRFNSENLLLTIIGLSALIMLSSRIIKSTLGLFSRKGGWICR